MRIWQHDKSPCLKTVYIIRTWAFIMSEIMLQISDMNQLKPNLKAKLLTRINGSAPRSVWTPGDFLDLGGRAAVDKVLQRLTAAGTLRRVDRGLYDKPTLNSFTKQNSPPDPREVIEAVARRDQIRVLVDGMTAANDLGLTNAVPAKIVVHTDARLKSISLGKLDIIFKPTAASKLYWAGRPAMRIVQALHWLRDTMGRPDHDQMLQRRLSRLLHDPAKGRLLRDDLADGLSTLPAWMQTMLHPMFENKSQAR
ncbi:DUF6088 family protein [Pelagibius sp. Alg239-R121]|uniref:DUF6088 family protein n=1 Tax=Pelagibius sp. Alg239-R121 TaxID=2993448 RepID=UPI0024A6BC7A|nr:DUF6088 family protein [Pelagibius sp. Alg239-R121]